MQRVLQLADTVHMPHLAGASIDLTDHGDFQGEELGFGRALVVDGIAALIDGARLLRRPLQQPVGDR